jgi:hypothetical protein
MCWLSLTVGGSHRTIARVTFSNSVPVADWGLFGCKFRVNSWSLSGFENLITFASNTMKMGHPKAVTKKLFRIVRVVFLEDA